MRIRPTSLPLQLLILVVLPLLTLLLIIALGGAALHQAAMRDMLVSHNAPGRGWRSSQSVGST